MPGCFEGIVQEIHGFSHTGEACAGRSMLESLCKFVAHVGHREALLEAAGARYDPLLSHRCNHTTLRAVGQDDWDNQTDECIVLEGFLASDITLTHREELKE